MKIPRIAISETWALGLEASTFGLMHPSRYV